MSDGPPPLPLIAPPDWLAALSGPAVGTGGSGAPGSAGNPLTLDQANQLFADLAGEGHIPFNWPRDGCFARAHEMRRLMAERGIECRKAWNYASAGTYLEVKGTGIGDVTWGWHVAPTVMVQGPSGPQAMVIDPSMFDHPVTPQEWAGAQGDPHSKLEDSDSSLYFRDQGGTWSETDDNYTQTAQDLDYYRTQRELWDAGLIP